MTVVRVFYTSCLYLAGAGLTFFGGVLYDFHTLCLGRGYTKGYSQGIEMGIEKVSKGYTSPEQEVKESQTVLSFVLSVYSYTG